jgi:dienelactone hydrolase
MKIQLFIFTFLLSLSINVNASIQSKEISYSVNDTELIGFVAWDDAIKGKRPGVLVVHEWWGHNEYARTRAKDLAEEGYVGFALDMYGDNKLAQHPADAGKFMKEIMSRYDEMLARFNAGKEQLKGFEQVDANNIAAIGYCFGGAVVLNVARTSDDLAAVVSFHGNLEPLKKESNKINTPILALNGADDTFVSAESIENFKQEMKSRNADFKFVNYKGAKHSFTNKGSTAVGNEFDLPLEYNKNADEKSWKAMNKFFSKHLNSNKNKQAPKLKSY